jgi:hypothetical protein
MKQFWQIFNLWIPTFPSVLVTIKSLSTSILYSLSSQARHFNYMKPCILKILSGKSQNIEVNN